MELEQQTKTLKKTLQRLKIRFETGEPPKKISDYSFFEQMKQETNPIFDLLNKWEENALQFVKNKHVHVHPHQIIATKENMELTILHSYYIDIRKRQYMELYKSTLYIFDQLSSEIRRLQQIKKGEESD